MGHLLPNWAIGMGRVCVPSSEALTQPLTPKPGGGPEIDAVVDRKDLPCPGLQHQEDMVSVTRGPQGSRQS